jgi:heterodisulfide reductase subunit A-like polyferredoxin
MNPSCLNSLNYIPNNYRGYKTSIQILQTENSVRMIRTVAVIGGSVSGLSAGALLSRLGVRVKFFEANNKLDGCFANTKIGGYTFNDGAGYLCLPGILDHVFERSVLTLITGKASAHTTGMPVVYSFELVKVHRQP